jgi:hypothetical protein
LRLAPRLGEHSSADIKLRGIPMSERDPDSSFPGRDTYSRRGERGTSNRHLIVAALAAVLLIFGVFYFFGSTDTRNNRNGPASTSSGPP